MIEATLPLPPTTNNLYFNLKTGGRAKTSQYKAWLRTAQKVLLDAFERSGSPEFIDKVPMRLSVRVGATYRRDVTNCVKPIEDALCAFLPVPDDRYNDHVEIVRDPTFEGLARIRLEVM